MTTREFHGTGANSFEDDQGDGAFDFAVALESHLIAPEAPAGEEPVVFEGDEATWIDAPVAMVTDGAELEIVDLDELEIPVELLGERETPSASWDEIPVEIEGSAEDEGVGSGQDDAFTAWLRALVGAAEAASMFIGMGALRAFVSDGRASRRAFPYKAAETLAEANIARLEGEELVATAAFLRVVAEWRRVLAGEGGDFSKCGNRTFDEWSADFLARILGAPARFDWMKRELRARGVAAFGLVEAAA